MPELPEVETIRTQLLEFTPFPIKAVWTSDVSDSILKTKQFNPKNFTINNIKRHGKWLIFELDPNHFMLSHLGMSGTWIKSKKPWVEKHVHIVLSGPKGYLSYVDPRRFGYLHFFHKNELEVKLSQLGPDLTSGEITDDYLKKLFKKFPERQIKPFLLDQKYFAGVGNYIACEICAHAKVRPTRKAKTLTQNERKLLIQGAQKVLKQAIQQRGNTFQGGYRDATGEKGEALSSLVVFYQKTCQLCKQTPVKKITLSQRGTYYCPHCQK